ncbi:NAD-dependent epimerase/dehydratase family protein [Tamlana crocina]|uniref:NAD-dependent epimerase/dehydratase family protein n=1 Tax=Tamlana crocina TaxID=393006 RepID=A0ABX1D943_9FLAO|nr:NAD-dependent epimerase/dehydratase family protein [Tamlana crocina]NJX14895.1 NAD-dependent epimerase/dehydratase family protein [Tamlana crocina]
MILVTGGTGLVGAHLLYKLVNEGHAVRAIFRNERKLDNTKNVFSYYTDDYETIFKKIEWVEADILDVPALTEAFNGITQVYHCAAFVSFEPDKYQLLRKTNIEGTANIVNISLAKNIQKLCYASSVATLGSTLNNEPITENTFWNPETDNSVYAITKYGAEMEVWRGTQEGLNAVMVNPGVIIGSGIWRYGTGSLFKRTEKGLKFYTPGSVGLIAVEDVVSVMVQLMESNITNERFVLVAEDWSYKKFLQTLAKSVNAKPPKKQIGSTLLNIAWRLDWLIHKITGKRRQLTKQLAKSLTTTNQYSSKKIKDALGFEFQDMENTINAVGKQYLK